MGDNDVTQMLLRSIRSGDCRSRPRLLAGLFSTTLPVKRRDLIAPTTVRL
jgi:hypothetical protein